MLLAAGTVHLLCTPMVQAETPEQRCQRETAAWNSTQEALWRATHPGQEPGPGAWPGYVCVGGPDIPGTSGDTEQGNGVSDDLGGVPSPAEQDSGTGHQRVHRWEDDATPPGRVHRYEGFGPRESEYSQDMRLGGLGETSRGNQGGAAPVSSAPGDGTMGPGGARSNVPQVPSWEITVPEPVDTHGATGTESRRVRVVEDQQGRTVVVDDAGRATGEVIVSDPATGRNIAVARDESLAGQLFEVLDEAGAPLRNENELTTARSETPAAPHEESGRTSGDEQENRPATGAPGEGLLGTAGAVAGAAAVVARRVRRRDGSHRADIDWGGGRKQSLVLLEGPNSPREHVFDMDVPPGGRLSKNADGSVDVLDAQGNVVEHVQAPWAYDASGRKVPTWYEVGEDNRLVQIVDPQRTTALPVVADPDRKKARASAYKSKSAGGGKRPPRQKIKGIGQPPSSQKGSGKPTATAPKPSTPKPSAKPSPKPQQPVKQPEVKTLPPGSPRQKIKGVGYPPQSTAKNDPLASGRNILNVPPADPEKASVVPEGQYKPIQMFNQDGTVNPNYQNNFPKKVDSQGKDGNLDKHVRPGKNPLPPDYSQVGKPLPPNAPRRKITAVGGPQPDPYAQEQGGKGNNAAQNQKLTKDSSGKNEEENKGFRTKVKDAIRAGGKKLTNGKMVT
ncbi:hypothetical protein [Corynebacterium oculi]|uniref:Uncharacterized protein n=1 Tax=Corynebacterium oculi TaxID=1544416 RepID=A0A0Q1AEZ5_9CORY|nr:hypothetical protein [Corynebacterium oculi]KQB85240.1 hypothetical protein Cocul_00378 [Corynebacterium oculi]